LDADVKRSQLVYALVVGVVLLYNSIKLTVSVQTWNVDGSFDREPWSNPSNLRVSSHFKWCL